MVFNEFLLGKRSRLSWVDETSFGTGGNMANDGEVIGLNAVIEPDFNQNWQEILSAGAGSRSVEGFELGSLDLPFTLNFTPVNWKFLKYCGYDFDNVVNPALSTNYLHTGTLMNSLQSFKLEWAIFHTTPVVFTITGVGVLSATINFSKGAGDADSFITVSLSCYAKSVSIGSTPTTLASGVVTRSPFHFRHVKLTKSGSEVAEVNNGEISIDQGIDPSDSRYCNATLDREVGELIPKTHRVTGRYNLNVKDSTEFDEWDNGVALTDTKLEFIKVSGTGADADNVVMGLDGFVIGSAIPSNALDGVMNSDLVWKCKGFSPLTVRDNLNDY